MFVKVRAYVGNFASEIITENIRKLARPSRRRSFLTAAKPFTDTEKLFAGGAVGYLSTDFTDFVSGRVAAFRTYPDPGGIFRLLSSLPASLLVLQLPNVDEFPQFYRFLIA